MQLEFDSASASRLGGQSAAGKGCLTVFFLVFFLMGALFTVFILGETARRAAVWFWPEIECTVVSSGIDDSGDDANPYQPFVVFEYQIDGRRYEGTTITRGESASSSYDTARRTVERYQPGAPASCRANPDSPAEAVLESRFPFIVFVVFLPLVFVAIGAGGIYFIWKGAPDLRLAGRAESISQRARGSTKLGRRIVLALGLIFSAVGGILSIFLVVVPAVHLIKAATWEETPATVIQSTMRSWSTDDGTSHRADVLYEYEADGRLWRSNRTNFFPFTSGNWSSANAVLDRFPEGSSAVCYVDPGNPSRSVLDRTPHAKNLVGLFPLLFLLAGVGLTTYALRGHRRVGPGQPTLAERPEEVPSERILEPEAGPIAKVVGMLFIAAFWNGIVSIFVWQAIHGFRGGSPEWFLVVFLIPFVLVGLGLIGGVFYFLLATVNPQPHLVISPSAPRLGTRLRVTWRFTGRTGRIKHLKIALEGHEKATYRRGTDTYTDREAFASLDLVDTSADWEFAQGSAEVEIPEETMHSFASAHNEVIWSLYVNGDIPRWPDVNETFDIEVRPLAAERLLP